MKMARDLQTCISSPAYLCFPRCRGPRPRPCHRAAGEISAGSGLVERLVEPVS